MDVLQGGRVFGAASPGASADGESIDFDVSLVSNSRELIDINPIPRHWRRVTRAYGRSDSM